MSVQYSDLVNKNGTIYNTKTGQGYSDPKVLAADLGVAPASISWGSIQQNSNYTPGVKFGGTTPPVSVAPTPVPVPSYSPPPSASPAPTYTPPSTAPTSQTSAASNGLSLQFFLAADGKTVVDNNNNFISHDDYKRLTNQQNVPDAQLDWSFVNKTPPPVNGNQQGSGSGVSAKTDVLSDPNFTTGDPKLDAIYSQLSDFLHSQIEAGQTINPNIQLTPADVQKFIDQASAEVDPYYKSQIDAIKGDLATNLNYLSQQYTLKNQAEGQSFQKNLADTRESLAGNGLAFSGVRGQQENNLQTSEQNTLDSSAAAASKAASDAASAAGKQIGSRNLSDLNAPTLSGYSADLSGNGGVNATRALNYFNPGNTTGSLEYAANADKRNLSDFLQQQEVQKRSLSFGG